MRSYRLALALTVSLLSSCSFGSDRDYQLVVTWLLNGFVPDPELCQELGIARARLEVSSGAGRRVRTIEADCHRTVVNSLGQEFGGFVTSRSFAWEVDYTYTLTLLDANGNVRSTPPAQRAFYEDFNGADVHELGFLDYVAPQGQAAALHGEWSVLNQDLASACAAKSIGVVRIVAVSPYNEKFEGSAVVAEAPCAAGQFTSNGKVLARGDYIFRYEAYSTAGSFVEAGVGIPVLVDGAQDVNLPREMFVLR
jgi:hypothetical protein